MTHDEIKQLADEIGSCLLLAQKEILTFEEASKYTGLKKSSLYKLTAAKQIPHYKPNGKTCYFKRAELEDWLTANPVATVDELNAEALNYCRKNKL